MNLRDILGVDAYINGFKALTSQEALRFYLICIIPLLALTFMGNFLVITVSFLVWELPDLMYIPFIHEDPVGMLMERISIVGGVILAFLDIFKNINLK